VDRQQLNTIRAELKFQMSDEVDDATAQALGRMAGAQIIISGAISQVGTLYRLRIRALSVQSAQIEGQFNRNIPDGPTVAALVKSQATGYGSNTAIASNTSSTGNKTTTSNTAQVVTPPTTTTTTTTTIPPTPTYKVGDKGPGGGIIFYVNEAGFTLTANGTICHYLEAAPADLGIMKWASTDSKSTNITGTAVSVGAGKKNTDLILAADPNSPAANACKDYSSGGKSDWFLPSIGELTQLFNNRTVVGGLQYTSWLCTEYWSSSQITREVASYFSFDGGSQGSYHTKDSDKRVRPIRAF